MDKYFKYSELSNPTETIEISHPTDIKSKDSINEYSSPREMANFVAKKLAEFIEQELKSNTSIPTNTTTANQE